MENQPETIAEELAELGQKVKAYKEKPHLDLIEFMQAQVDEAFEDMIGNVSSDPMTYMRLQLRWQQREAMLRAATIYTESQEKQYNQLMSQLEEELQNA